MSELDLQVMELLEEHVPLRNEAQPDWRDVLRRAGVHTANGHAPAATHKPRRSRRRLLLIAAVVAIAGTALSPLGPAVAALGRDAFEGFSSWLRGTPGDPVGAEEQRAFEEENARSYAAFPGSPQLRRLTRTEIDGVSYELLGFRSGNALCLRIVATGAANGSTLMCAPVDELRYDETPVRVLVADWPVGKGEKTATFGFDTYRASRAQVTAGIAADGVRAVELVDDHGSHRVDADANAFLYVAPRPDVGQRITHVRAELDDGSTVGVPFAMAPWGSGGGFGGSRGEPGGPTRVERVVRGGAIGWLDRREERGEPLDAVVRKVGRLGDAEFGRLITPEPQSSKRIAVTISTLEFGPQKGVRAVCTFLVTRGGTGGGCTEPHKLFDDVPFTFGYSSIGAGDQFATFDGIASDDVARLEIFTATGNRIDVALRDNAYLAEVALARLPAKMVAYDAQGRVIGIRETPREDGPARVVGDPIHRLTATAEGDSLEIVAYRTKEGGQCWFAQGTGNARVRVSSCVGKDWNLAPLRLSLLPDPAVFVYGRVREDIKRITLRYADGSKQQIEPERDGYVLFVVPPERRTHARRLIEFSGHDAQGELVARQRLPAQKP